MMPRLARPWETPCFGSLLAKFDIGLFKLYDLSILIVFQQVLQRLAQQLSLFRSVMPQKLHVALTLLLEKPGVMWPSRDFACPDHSCYFNSLCQHCALILCGWQKSIAHWFKKHLASRDVGSLQQNAFCMKCHY